MGRKIQITQAQILQAGLELIEREGAAAVQIKRLAASLGCSTQPILWQFGSMEAYRQALFQYAVEAVRQRIKPKGADAVLDFWRIGATYVDLAVDTPQLLRYLRADPAALQAAGGIGLLYDSAAQARAVDGVAAQLQLPRDVAEQLLFLIVYTEGLVSLTLNGLLQVEKQQAYAMLQNAAACFLAKQAADRENRIKGKEGSDARAGDSNNRAAQVLWAD